MYSILYSEMLIHNSRSGEMHIYPGLSAAHIERDLQECLSGNWAIFSYVLTVSFQTADRGFLNALSYGLDFYIETRCQG